MAIGRKDIAAHLASFEHVLVDVLQAIVSDAPTPHLDKFRCDFESFNDDEVEIRRDLSAAQVWAEYQDSYARAAELLPQIPIETRRRNGLLVWYGDEYDLEDFIAYTFYGHKQEHSAQIGVFKDRNGGQF